MLYEPHVMDRSLSRFRPALLSQARAAGLAYPAWGTRPYPPAGDARWTVFDHAAALDMECACRATSWGLGQVLGEGFAALNYGSASALAHDAMVSEARQLGQMVAFIKAHKLDAALVRQDWRAFALGYNGGGQVDAYANKLQLAYAAPHSVQLAMSEADRLNQAQLDAMSRAPGRWG